MNILIVSSLPSRKIWSRAGGFAIRLAEMGNAVILATASPNDTFRFREHLRFGIRVVEFPTLLPRGIADPIAAAWLQSWLTRKKIHCDVIHLFDPSATTLLAGFGFARKHNIPAVLDWDAGATLESPVLLWPGLRPGSRGPMDRHFLASAQAITVRSRALGHSLSAKGFGRPELLRSGVPANARAAANGPALRRRLGFTEQDFVAGISNTALSAEQLDRVLDGLRLARYQGIRIRLAVFGKPSRLMIARIKDNGLWETTRIADSLLAGEHPAWLTAADALLLPFPESVARNGQWPEPFGRYLASGRPVIFNPCGELAAFKDNPPGIAIPFSGPFFGDALVKLSQSPSERTRLGARGIEIAATQFSWATQTLALQSLYQDTCASYAAEHATAKRSISMAYPLLRKVA